MLTDVQKAGRAETSASLLSLFNENPDKFISRFVTVDETWLTTLILKEKHKVWPGNMSLNSTSLKVSCGRISPQSHGHRILGFWRNCID